MATKLDAFMGKEHYNLRAAECLAFARTSRNEEERKQMLLMATTLEQLAVQRETRANEKQHKKTRLPGSLYLPRAVRS
jgi:hypothetical protein